MFEKIGSIDLKPLAAYTDAALSLLKRIKFLNNGEFLVFENDSENFSVRRISSSGELLREWTANVPGGLAGDYHYIDGRLFMAFSVIKGEYEEEFRVYASDKSGAMVLIFSALRESYQHDMDYFKLFPHGRECRALLIRHNRVHLYSLNDKAEEIAVLEGQKWFLSQRHVVCALGREWELYDLSLELLANFKFEEEADWLNVESSSDGQTVVVSTNNSLSEIGGLVIFDRQKDDYEVHYQRYGFYDHAVCYGRIWATVGSVYSGLGGLMIFDKNASLKFAHLRDETEGDTLRAYHPAPLVYQSVDMGEILDGKVYILDYENVVVTDLTCRPLQELKHCGFDCFIISEDGRHAASLNLKNRLLGAQPETKYEAALEIYNWSASARRARVVDLTSFRK